MRSLYNTDKVFAVLLIAFAAIMYVIIGGTAAPYSPGALSASTYPRLILLCMIFTSCLILIRPGTSSAGIDGTFSLKGLSAIVLTALYIGLIETAGFFILTPIFLSLLPVTAGFRRYGMILISASLVTAVLYGVFVGVLNIPLPEGILGD